MNQNKTTDLFNKNCFDIIRYYAAFSVMILHFTGYFYMTAAAAAEPVQTAHILHKIPVTVPPVVIFFCLSGFFAMASLSRTPNPIEYLKKRAYRLYPSIWLCTIINLIAIVIISGKSTNIRQLLVWLPTQVLGVANTPGFFKSIATGSVNGPLWTIGVLIQLYVLFAIFHKYICKFKLWGWGIILAATLLANIGCQAVTDVCGTEGAIGKLIERSFVPYLIYALIGAVAFRYLDALIPILKKIWPVFLVVLLCISNMNLPDYGYYSGIITAVCTCLLSIGVGYIFKVRVRLDISYELFLYHWIVLNFIVHYDLFNRFSLGMCMLIFFAGSIALALAAHALISVILNITKSLSANINRG